MLHTTRRAILSIIDFFYPPFKQVFSLQTFRYLACGGGNTLLDILLYFVFYNFVLDKQAVPLVGDWKITAHIAAFIASFSITFPIGFALNKYVVFVESNLRGRVQLFRYAMTVATCIVLNYIFIKFFVEYCNIYPTVSKIITTVIVAFYSYFTQRLFTFKVKQTKESIKHEVYEES
jgi:putative flippase GtrA